MNNGDILCWKKQLTLTYWKDSINILLDEECWVHIFWGVGGGWGLTKNVHEFFFSLIRILFSLTLHSVDIGDEKKLTKYPSLQYHKFGSFAKKIVGYGGEDLNKMTLYSVI